MRKQEQNLQLRPCPFCGGDAVIRQYGNDYESTIYGCFDCGCELSTGENRDYGHRWNQRAIERELLEALQESTKALIAERDAFYDSITDHEGNITDPADGEGLRELDALIDRNQAAIAKAGGAS